MHGQITVELRITDRAGLTIHGTMSQIKSCGHSWVVVSVTQTGGPGSNPWLLLRAQVSQFIVPAEIIVFFVPFSLNL